MLELEFLKWRLNIIFEKFIWWPYYETVLVVINTAVLKASAFAITDHLKPSLIFPNYVKA
jgi:hypothetical protein